MIATAARTSDDQPRAFGAFVCAWICVCVLAPSHVAARGGTDDESPIKRDEHVVFFPTHAWPDADGEGWQVEVHGWIHEPEAGSAWRDLLIEAIAELPGLEQGDADNPILQRRMRQFLADNERGKQLTVQLGDKLHLLEPSQPNGHFRSLLSISADDAARATMADGWIHYVAITRADDPRRFVGRACPLSGAGLSVISDIDDTLKLSHVTDQRALVRTTFLEEFTVITGMPTYFEQLAARGAAFHYVSSSPWQLYPDLVACFASAGLPAGSFHLTDFRIKDETLLALFANPEDTKPAQIEPLLERFPERRFLLVGDSGEKDPEIYASLARSHRERIERILIRQTEGADNTPARFDAAFAGLPADLWQVFTKSSELEEQ